MEQRHTTSSFGVAIGIGIDPDTDADSDPEVSQIRIQFAREA
jgi:hypothetical protein